MSALIVVFYIMSVMVIAAIAAVADACVWIVFLLVGHAKKKAAMKEVQAETREEI